MMYTRIERAQIHMPEYPHIAGFVSIDTRRIYINAAAEPSAKEIRIAKDERELFRAALKSKPPLYMIN